MAPLIEYVWHYNIGTILSCVEQITACAISGLQLKDICRPSKRESIEGPTTCITFLGFKINSVEEQVRLPMAKVGCCWKSECNAKKQKKPELLSIVGKLQHTATVVWSGLLDQSAGGTVYILHQGQKVLLVKLLPDVIGDTRRVDVNFDPLTLIIL